MIHTEGILQLLAMIRREILLENGTKMSPQL